MAWTLMMMLLATAVDGGREVEEEVLIFGLGHFKWN